MATTLDNHIQNLRHRFQGRWLTMEEKSLRRPGGCRPWSAADRELHSLLWLSGQGSSVDLYNTPFQGEEDATLMNSLTMGARLKGAFDHILAQATAGAPAGGASPPDLLSSGTG